MKRLKKICLMCFIFCIILINNNVFAQTGIVTGKNVRLREKATTNSKILSTMSKEQKVEIIGEEDNWYNVKYKDNTGYVSKEFIKIEENKKEEIKEDIDKPVENTNVEQSINMGTEYTLQKESKLKLRPNFSSIVLDNLQVGDKITVNNQIGNWLEIKFKEKYGWILKNTIEVVIEDKKEENEESQVIKPEQEEKEEKPQVGNNINDVFENITQEEI